MREPGPRLHDKLLLLAHAQVTQQAMQPLVHQGAPCGTQVATPGLLGQARWSCGRAGALLLSVLVLR